MNGVYPEKFWDMTLREVICMINQQRSRDEMMWNHTSSLLAMHAQINSSKGKQYSAADFHPYISSKGSNGINTRSDAEGLVEKLKKF